MAEEPPSKRKCLGPDCDNDVQADLQCPKCLSMGIKTSVFCSQDCFKRNWNAHKVMHQQQNGQTQDSGTYNPWPNYHFAGPLKPRYPIEKKRTIPKGIKKPDYADTGIPKYKKTRSSDIDLLDAEAQEGMRTVCRMAREVLDEAAAEVKPGVTTEYLDDIVYNACIKRKAYPSPLNYNFFPKSVCTSVNEVICHGIPDKRVLEDGDIINLDVTLYYGGFHGDLNETYYVGDKAKADPDTVRVVETARECLELAIKEVKPDTLFREFGNVIEKHAKAKGCSVIRTYVGHGINRIFHCPPNIPHYAKNKAVGKCKPGMTFTIEPMIALGSYRDVTWPDNWTSTTIDGKLTAQFEHTLLVTEDGVEILTARTSKSPGGPLVTSKVENGPAAADATINGTANAPEAATNGTANAPEK